jgi:glycosyltransferase involved in cell wall biosynthesis
MNTATRVIIVTTMPSTVDVFLVEQIRGMQSQGYEVTVVCSPDERLGRLRAPGIDMLPLRIPRSLSPIGLLKALFGLWRLFDRQRPQLIHTHTPIAAFLGQLAARMARVPCRVTTVHGLYFVNEQRFLPRFLYRILEVIACRLATKVICVSGEDAAYLVREQDLPPANVSTFHVGVDLDVYSPEAAGPAARAATRNELNIPQDAIVVGTVARLVKEKGLVELFEAFASVARDYPNVYLLHVGPQDDTRPDAVRPVHTSGRVRFAGHRYDVPRFLATMDVFCLPTHREGYPVSVMEAAAMGLPSVVTDVRGCREAVVAGETGLIVPVRDPAALIVAIRRLLDSPAMRERMSAAALKRAREHFDRKEVVRRTLDLYTAELSRR